MFGSRVAAFHVSRGTLNSTQTPTLNSPLVGRGLINDIYRWVVSSELYITSHDPLPDSYLLHVSRVDKRYIYNTPDTGCLECYRPHASVNTTTPKINHKHIHCRNMLEIRQIYDTIYTVKIVNKRPHNLLNEIQNDFINVKQVKTAKITQIIP